MQRTQGGMTGTGRGAGFIRALPKVPHMPTGFQETEFLSVCALRILWELWVCIRPQTSFRVPLSAQRLPEPFSLGFQAFMNEE